MMAGEQLQIISDSICQHNSLKKIKHELTLILTGDFAQLPPVKGKWAFETDTWEKHFAPRVERLDKIWRQTDERFLEGLRLARQGLGQEAVEALEGSGVEWARGLDENFPGATLFAKNEQAGNYNLLRLGQLEAKPRGITTRFAGWIRPEIRKEIPTRLVIKEGARVMLRRNLYGVDTFNFRTKRVERELIYANGDQGEVVGYGGGDIPTVLVRLLRNGKVVIVRCLTETVLIRGQRAEPVDITLPPYNVTDGFKPYWDSESKSWVVGTATWMPMSLCWGITVHKSQGMTLDALQIDPANQFFGSPAMAYVALSRVRSPGGLRIVGNKGLLAARVKMSEKIGEWI